MKRHNITLGVLTMAALFAVIVLWWPDPKEHPTTTLREKTLDSIPSLSPRHTPITSETPISVLSISSQPADLLNEIPPSAIIAPESHTLAQYELDEALFKNNPIPKDDNAIDNEPSGRFRPIDLWQPSTKTAKIRPNKDKLDKRLFIDLNEENLSSLQTGDSVLLKTPDGSMTRVVIDRVEQWRNQAKNWTLSDETGKIIGSFTQTPSFTEGEFQTSNDKHYFLRSVQGNGWIAEKEDLLNNIPDSFTRSYPGN